MKSFIILICFVLLAACNNSDNGVTPTGSGNLSGEWDSNFDEVSYMNLNHNGENVSGDICERRNFDCITIRGGTVYEDQFTFYYTFGNPVEYVDGVFRISLGGTKLSGALTLRSTEESVDIVFYKR